MGEGRARFELENRWDRDAVRCVRKKCEKGGESGGMARWYVNASNVRGPDEPDEREDGDGGELEQARGAARVEVEQGETGGEGRIVLDGGEGMAVEKEGEEENEKKAG